MKQTKIIMDMHITIEVIDQNVSEKDISAVYAYFTSVDNTFSVYKDSSEISQINKGRLTKNQYSPEMLEVLTLCERTKKESKGYFNIYRHNKIDPAGIVKSWAILRAAGILKKRGMKNFYIDAGGDIQVSGKNSRGKNWSVGIQNPFDISQVIKKICLKDCGVATSGTYRRGQHIYNPFSKKQEKNPIISLTVIGPDILEADRFATPAFAMGKKGIYFIESLPGLEGYMIDANGIATYTTGFQKYIN